MRLVLKSKSKEETAQIAEVVAHVLRSKDVVLLYGELGAGKTTFTQGLARGLDVKEVVKSPTFNIVKIYESGRLPLFHIDAYRLEGQVDDIGIQEYADSYGICVIEWPNFLDFEWVSATFTITIERLSSRTRRVVIESEDKRIFSVEKEVKLWLMNS